MGNSSLIVAIDGGGALGVGPALYLSKLERDHGDLGEAAVAGTSAGGILALLRAAGYTWGEVYEIFSAEVSQIFSARQLALIGPKWDVHPLQALALKYLSLHASDARLPFFVVASNSTRGCLKVFDRTDDCTLADIAMATSAAPTYFPPHQIGDDVYVDGGLIANNPALYGLIGAMRARLVAQESARVLSLATGGNCWADPKLHERMLITAWISPVIKLAIAGRQQGDAFAVSQILADRHVRVCPTSQDYDMDDLSVLEKWRQLWAEKYTTDELHVWGFLSIHPV